MPCEARGCWNRERARLDDASQPRSICQASLRVPRRSLSCSSLPLPSTNLEKPDISHSDYNTAMNAMKDDIDADMLFHDSIESCGSQDASLSDGPQLSRSSKHHDVIMRIEAVFETVADALLNERADVTISLTSESSGALQDTAVRARKAVFSFPGKTASDAWRFCW